MGFNQTAAEIKCMLCFDSLAQREQMDEDYYASDDWRKGPREALLALIESYTDIVFEVDEVTMRGLRVSY